jgi:hypothetical protein
MTILKNIDKRILGDSQGCWYMVAGWSCSVGQPTIELKYNAPNPNIRRIK